MARFKTLTHAAVLLAALAGGCAFIPKDTPSDSLIGEWVVEDINNGGVIDNANLTVAFDETGRIYGSAGCNRFTGAYTFESAADTVKITPLGVTRRLCLAPAVMTQEQKLVASLQAATRAETQADGAVALTSADGRVLLRRRTPAPTAAKPAAAAPAAAAPVYDPANDPLAPSATVTAPAAPASVTALPPPSTSSYPLAGGASSVATPAAVGAPMSTAPAYASTPAPTYTPVPAQPPAPYVAPTPYTAAPAAQAESRRITASGELYFLEQVTLPPDATVRVQLRDVARVDAPATVLGQQEFPAATGQPYKFSVTAPVSVIAPQARLTLFAQILSGNRLLFITDTHNAVPLDGTSTPLRVRLVNAAPAPTRAQVQSPPRTTTPATTSVPAPPAAYTGAPVAPTPPADIPGSVSYRCGAETFRLSFEERVAFLTTADGAVARLTRIDTSDDTSAPRMFSNSILTLLKENGADGRVRFARGRMALTTCTRS